VEWNSFLFEIYIKKYEREKYIVADNIESGFGNKIPLWIFVLINKPTKIAFGVSGIGVN
jgi:hypothetical protein